MKLFQNKKYYMQYPASGHIGIYDSIDEAISNIYFPMTIFIGFYYGGYIKTIEATPNLS